MGYCHEHVPLGELQDFETTTMTTAEPTTTTTAAVTTVPDTATSSDEQTTTTKGQQTPGEIPAEEDCSLRGCFDSYDSSAPCQ